MMLKITESLQLKSILYKDTETLFGLMQEVYPQAYAHFWEDEGAWYVNKQYAKEAVLKELSNANAEYYFVVFKDEIIGNFRIVWDEKLAGLSEEKQVKLHRIYLHQKSQGNGIGKQLLAWLEEKAVQKGVDLIWLDAMDEKTQAFQFYKKLGYLYHSHTFLQFELLHDAVRKMSHIYKKLGFKQLKSS